jgi:YesN/AraC family two-component response regulator
MKTISILDTVMQHVMTVSDEEFSELTVCTLAYSFNIDRYKLLRQFKNRTNMTLEDFLFKEKMARAAFLLHANSDITVKEVSKKVGYSTSDYFIRKFKQYYGIVPGKYKELKSTCPTIEMNRKPPQGNA